MKVGNTDFNEAHIKEMSFKEFKKTYEKILKGQNLEEVYAKLTGKKVESK